MRSATDMLGDAAHVPALVAVTYRRMFRFALKPTCVKRRNVGVRSGHDRIVEPEFGVAITPPA